MGEASRTPRRVSPAFAPSQLPKLCAPLRGACGGRARIAFRYGHRRDDQNVVVLMPFCHKHRSFQEQWPLLVWCIAGPLVIFAIGAAHTIFFDGHPMVLGVVLAVLIAIFVGVFAWLILESRRIRVSRSMCGISFWSGCDKVYSSLRGNVRPRGETYRRLLGRPLLAARDCRITWAGRKNGRLGGGCDGMTQRMEDFKRRDSRRDAGEDYCRASIVRDRWAPWARRPAS